MRKQWLKKLSQTNRNCLEMSKKMADKPVTREEKYLAYLTGDYTGEIPKPITRKEKYLYKLCIDGIGTSKEAIAEAVQTYLSDKGVGLDMDADGYVSLKAKESDNNG